MTKYISNGQTPNPLIWFELRIVSKDNAAIHDGSRKNIEKYPSSDSVCNRFS